MEHYPLTSYHGCKLASQGEKRWPLVPATSTHIPSRPVGPCWHNFQLASSSSARFSLFGGFGRYGRKSCESQAS